jgi:hypothetical protein
VEPVGAELQFSKATGVRLFLRWLPFRMLLSLILFAPIGVSEPFQYSCTIVNKFPTYIHSSTSCSSQFRACENDSETKVFIFSILRIANNPACLTRCEQAQFAGKKFPNCAFRESTFSPPLLRLFEPFAVA